MEDVWWWSASLKQLLLVQNSNLELFHTLSCDGPTYFQPDGNEAILALSINDFVEAIIFDYSNLYSSTT